MEMRDIIKEENYAFKRIYEQLEKMDFNNFICSPLMRTWLDYCVNRRPHFARKLNRRLEMIKE